MMCSQTLLVFTKGYDGRKPDGYEEKEIDLSKARCFKSTQEKTHVVMQFRRLCEIRYNRTSVAKVVHTRLVKKRKRRGTINYSCK